MNALHMHLKCSILYLMFFKYLHFDNDLDLGLNKPDAGAAAILPHQPSAVWQAFSLCGAIHIALQPSLARDEMMR